ncbi:hypothetical protein DSUL_60250 [Desulfovibrionales bacterium]
MRNRINDYKAKIVICSNSVNRSRKYYSFENQTLTRFLQNA